MTVYIPLWASALYVIGLVVTYFLVKSVRNDGNWTLLDFLIAMGMSLLWPPALLTGLVIFFSKKDYNDRFPI